MLIGNLPDQGNSPGPWLLFSGTAVLVFILILRLFQLQILEYDNYSSKSDARALKRDVIVAPRGFIYDRNGEVLAENKMGYSITFDPRSGDYMESSIKRLTELVPDLPERMGVPADSIIYCIKQKFKTSRNPEKILRNIDFVLLSLVEEHSDELPGIGTVFEQQREYLYGKLAAHAIGYLNDLTPEEAENFADIGYERTQTIGRFGIEKFYEETLKGSNGAKFVQRNFHNIILDKNPEVSPIAPMAGKDLTLTIDLRLQKVVEEAFGDSTVGGLVAIDPRNGEVLAMKSAPAFDPNDFCDGMSRSEYDAIINHPDRPMFNRAIQATYPPGSTYKPLTAIAGLSKGMTENSRFKPCRGGFTFGRTYKCWEHRGHGSLNMIEALSASCNVYFYQVGLSVGLEDWAKTGESMGLGKKTGIDLSGEVTGTLPSSIFYKEVRAIWSPGMILNLAIGQGENLATVVQLAKYAGMIATSGLSVTPHLVKSAYVEPKHVPIPDDAFRIVREGMFGVVNSPIGTAKSMRVPGHLVAAKTGTSQNPHGADHKLAIAFAPYDNPTIAVACVMENAGNLPYSLAVVITKKLLTEYLVNSTEQPVVAIK